MHQFSVKTSTGTYQIKATCAACAELEAEDLGLGTGIATLQSTCEVGHE